MFEDDQIRIWEMCLKPGEHSETHFHGLPYAIVDSYYLCAGSTEVAKNTGTKTYRDIQVEFKQDLATQEFKLSNR